MDFEVQSIISVDIIILKRIDFIKAASTDHLDTMQCQLHFFMLHK